MKNTCVKCGSTIDGLATTGRPKAYCSTACRRSAELEVRRLNSRLEKLEVSLSNTRLGYYSFEPEKDAAKLVEEIAIQEARLIKLLTREDSISPE